MELLPQQQLQQPQQPQQQPPPQLQQQQPPPPQQQQQQPQLSDCDCSWAHGHGEASCAGGDDGSRCWKACCVLPQGKTLAISLASGVNQRTLASGGTSPQPQPQAAPSYTAKDCSCGWASHGVCAAGSDDGSVCW